jgi:hypothetical protein
MGARHTPRPNLKPAEVSLMAKRVISLSNELQLLMEGIRGVHSLTCKFIDSYGMETALPENISALLVVLIERLRLVDRVVRGTVDPRLAWSPENDSRLSPSDPREEDVLLQAWSERRLARHHRREWKRARARLKEKKTASDRPPATDGRVARRTAGS